MGFLNIAVSRENRDGDAFLAPMQGATLKTTLGARAASLTEVGVTSLLCLEINKMRELSSRKVVAAENILIRELSGEAVLLDLNKELYFGLDEVGYRMWTVLTSADTVGAAYEQLLSEYEVEPEQLEKSVESLISQCVDQGLFQFASPK
jgi:hypothetical protein